MSLEMVYHIPLLTFLFLSSLPKALNKLNADWNFCTHTEASTGMCNGLDVVVDCSRRNRVRRQAEREGRQAAAESDDVYDVRITFPSAK